MGQVRFNFRDVQEEDCQLESFQGSSFKKSFALDSNSSPLATPTQQAGKEIIGSFRRKNTK